MPRTGRPRTFDELETLARARDVFWARGYAATSVQDLVEELTVQRGSLYGTFGDKRSLYLRAVSLYAQQNLWQLESLLAADPILPTLRRMLTRPATLTGAEPAEPRRGCLVGNTTAELVPEDADAQALVAAAYDGFVRVVAAAIRRAQAAGEVAATAEPEAVAQMILLLFQGSALVSRAGADSQRTNAAIDAALAALPAADARPAR